MEAEVQMKATILEGNELEGKIGEYGNYKVDIDASGKAVGAASGAYEKQVLPWLKIRGLANIEIEADMVGGVIAWGAKSNNSIIKGMATKLAVLTGRTI